MPTLLTAGLTTSTALLLGCGSGADLAPRADPPPGFAFAYASPSCAPWDGPAVQILLTGSATTDPEHVRPQLRVAIYPGATGLTRRSYRWPADPEAATGARCTGDACEVATAGEINLGPARPDSALDGMVTLEFSSHEVVSGGFLAVWQPRRILCG